jgi:uncharacterized protein YkwD
MFRPLLTVLALLIAPLAAADPAALPAINSLRAEAGRGPLSYSAELERIAAGHARDMARQGVMTHYGADGSGPGDRARRAGYRFCRVAENVAYGQRSLQEVLQSWADSRGHRRNMLDRRVSEVGIARAEGNFWVMFLGGPGC